MKPLKSNKLRSSARNKQCTLNVAGVCNYDPATVVLCHINTEGSAMGAKADDYSAVFGCYECHHWLDNYHGPEEDRLFYTRRALVRTWRIWIEEGYVKI